MRVTIKMASGPEPRLMTPEGDTTANYLKEDLSFELRDTNHIVPEVTVSTKHERTKSVDSLEHCIKESYVAVATTAREQVADILKRGSCSPSRYGLYVLETSSSENVESQSSQAEQMEGCTRDGEFTPHASSLTMGMPRANFAHSELLPRAWKGKGETLSMYQTGDTSVSDELQEVICCCMSW